MLTRPVSYSTQPTMRTRHNAFASPPLPSTSRTLTGAPADQPIEPPAKSDSKPSIQQSTSHFDDSQDLPSTKQQKSLSPSHLQESLYLPAPQFTNPLPGPSKFGSLPVTLVNMSTQLDGTRNNPADDVSQPLDAPTSLQPAVKGQGRKRARPTASDLPIQDSSLLYQTDLAAAAGHSGRPSIGCSGGFNTSSRSNDQHVEGGIPGAAESSALVRAVRRRHNSTAIPVADTKAPYSTEPVGTAAVSVAAPRPPVWPKPAAAAAEIHSPRGTQGRKCAEGAAACQPVQVELLNLKGRANHR